GLVIYAQRSPEEQAAIWEFINWVFTDAINDRAWVDATGMLPMRGDLTTNATFAKVFEDHPELKGYADEMAYAVPAMANERFADVQTVLGKEGLIPVILGQKTPEQGWADVRAAMQALGFTLPPPPPNKPPVCAFVFSPTSPKAGDTVTFDASGSRDPDGSIDDYRWEFGDGTCASGSKVTKRFHQNGSYVVWLSVTDKKKASACCSKTVSVQKSDTPSPGRLDWVNGQQLGAGKISKTAGFVFGTYSCSLVNKKKSTLTKDEENILATAKKLFDALGVIAKARLPIRLGATSGKSYRPTYTTGMQTDPYQAFTQWLHDKFIKGKSGEDALKAMAANVPAPDGDDPAGIPGGPTAVYWGVYYHNNTAGAGEKILSIGSKYLLGHWEPSTWDDKHDFTSQTQNATDILHFNTGLGWQSDTHMYDMKFALLMAATWLARQAGDVIDLPTAFIEAFAGPKAKEGKKREFYDVANLAYAFGGNHLDAFIAYDIASFEGFHVFSIDALNDIIATEAGRIFAEELKKKTVAQIAGAGSIRTLMDAAFKAARDSFTKHKVLVGARKAFYSTLLAIDGCGKFVPVVELYEWTDDTIWKATLGTILYKNRATLTTGEKQNAFVKKIVDHLKNGIGQAGAWGAVGGVAVTAEDVEALNQMVEILMLLP
ncbi:PKD domain-containing protein, partial [Candidatus Bipolaricaulota bacterium]|nr:PKD domain-containing protein [Candidatus Bipolaricaulota bacterium]